MSPAELTAALTQEAVRLGFALARATPAVAPSGINHLCDWLDAGYAGQMRYLGDRLEAYADPRHVLDGVGSLLLLATAYRTEEPVEPQPGQGRVSRFGWGQDYHDVIHGRLKRLAALHRQLVPEAAVRGVVDTAPLLEREFAQRAGLGWIGKNTMLLNRSHGSWLFLAALLTTEPLEYAASPEDNHCGSCRACLDACPTGALVGPYQLDARQCISYLTIELRESIPSELRESIGDRVFGCDACQDACPWNRRAAGTTEQSFHPADGTNPLDLCQLFTLDEEAFRQRFRHTPFWRSRRRGLLRNAAIVLGNQKAAAAVPWLIRGLEDCEPLIRGACAWALGRCVTDETVAALKKRLPHEPDLDVKAEIETVLAGC